jgi:isopropylmalate/homocitrate/citramalate synthase
MVEIGIAEYFSMGGALGIIGSLFVVLYFSRKQMQTLSADIETKILNDMDERMREITQIGVERPELIKVLSNALLHKSDIHQYDLKYDILSP